MILPSIEQPDSEISATLHSFFYQVLQKKCRFFCNINPVGES
jgi:hypothetical protein